MRKELKIRCYAEKDGNVWVAACIDFCLAAQDRSLDVAVEKLHQQIKDHVLYALEHKEYTQQLLSRKAPIHFFAKYYWILLKCNFFKFVKSSHEQVAKVYTDRFQQACPV